MSRALEIFKTRWAKLAACRNSTTIPPQVVFTDPRLKPFDTCAKPNLHNRFPGDQINLITAPASERAQAVRLANTLRGVSTSEIPTSVIPSAIQATHRLVTRRTLLENPLAPAVITQSGLVSEERIYVSQDNDLVIASQHQASRQLDIITGQPRILSTDGFQSLEDTLDAVKKVA